MPPKPAYPGVYVEETPFTGHDIAGVSTAVTAFVGPARRGPFNRAVRITSFSGFEQRFGDVSAKLETGYAVRQYFLNGGREAWVVRVGQNPNQTQLQAGLRALDAVDLFNLLVLPGMTSPDAVALAAAHCQKHRAFLIADAPATAKTPAEMEAAVRNLALESKSHVAIYHPWIRITDATSRGQSRLSAPSGTMAGLFARTDGNRGVWKAPAGTEATLKGVTGLERQLTDSENGSMNARGINCLRSFPALGAVAWGARTLAGDDQLGSEYNYIPVRRLALWIEESIDRGTKWAVFEPNDEPLWAQLRQHMNHFMESLFRQGAFQGQTTREAYLVKCGADTTSQTDVANGRVNIIVGFAPLKPAEFVVLQLTQRAGQRQP